MDETPSKYTSKDITIPVPWGHIAGKQWGNADHQKLFAIHGKQDNCAVFDRIIPRLNGDYFVVAIDLPGHGLSSHFPAGLPIHFPNYVFALNYVLRWLKWNSFYYIGHSLGGLMGLLLAALRPETVEKLIVIDHLSLEFSADGNALEAMQSNFEDFFRMQTRLENGKAPVYTYEETLNKMLTRDSYLTKEAAEIVLERSLQKSNKQDDRYLFRMDQRIKLHPFPSLTYSLAKEILLNVKCPCYILLSSDRIKVMEHLFSDLFPVLKNRNFRFTTVQGNHDFHQNTPGIIERYVDEFFFPSSRL